MKIFHEFSKCYGSGISCVSPTSGSMKVSEISVYTVLIYISCDNKYTSNQLLHTAQNVVQAQTEFNRFKSHSHGPHFFKDYGFNNQTS